MMTDTIAAIATPPGQGGVAVLRLSGVQALAIGTQITGIEQPLARQAILADFRDSKGNLIDQGLMIYFRAPHSFTGEDVIELQGHGGYVVTQLLLQACLDAGARLAEAGEFSKRAFLNEKIDLIQAEAIADLIAARSQAAAKAASQSLQGYFSHRVNTLATELFNLRTYVEAALDFPEEEIDFIKEGKIAEHLTRWGIELDHLLRDTTQGKLLNDGIKIVLAGKPNAGKSSLLNALIGEERAIVTAYAGTTRDIIREQIIIDGIPIQILDTAGLRYSEDAIEQEGIRRSQKALVEADIVIWIIDATEIKQYRKCDIECDFSKNTPILQVYNKMDLINPEEYGQYSDGICIAAKTGMGLDKLRQKIVALAGKIEQDENVFIARERHIRALEECRYYYNNALEQINGSCLSELIAEDLRLAHHSLGTITGNISSDDLLGAIFSSFCIGK